MPLYEYKCDACDNRFERIVKFSDPPLEVCPACGGKVQKLFSSPAIQFKGSGFYITDYAKKSSGDSKSSLEKSSDKASDAAKSDSSKSEGKSNTGKSDAGKSDAAKSDAGKSDAGKREGTAPAPAPSSPSAKE
ncbi:MAG: zinc ribbon domain-containing protein [Acidobacteria bacterium]|nr:zinc ribbon domain-containing protein [Acidobacteriota bacterium]